MKINSEVFERFTNMTPASPGEPIPVTGNSYPFSAMKHARVPLDVGEYGFLEEEYFFEGQAATYRTESDTTVTRTTSTEPPSPSNAQEPDAEQVRLDQPPTRYVNRVLVRRPADPEKFSGRVYVDILNASTRVDFEDFWQRAYKWCLTNNHMYVGITSKPLCVDALRTFDADRYQPLTWPVRNDEEQQGAFWDILTEAIMALRGIRCQPMFPDYKIKRLYLNGQSQSGAYLNTYLSYFYPIIRQIFTDKLYDGFINLVGVQFSRSIGQEHGPMVFQYRHASQTDVPYLCITSEGDYGLFHAFNSGDLLSHRPENANTPENKCAYYEIPGAPHYDALGPVIPCVEDIRRSGINRQEPDEERARQINQFPMREYMVALFDQLHNWVETGIAPTPAEPFAVTADGQLARDSYGNVIGGLRTTFIDVPIYTYLGSTEGFSGEGKQIPLTKEQFNERYGSVEAYMEELGEHLEEDVRNGFLLRK